MASLGIAVTGWEAISPLGIGAGALSMPQLSAAVAAPPMHVDREHFPGDIHYRTADFDVAGILGAKGIRTMDRTTALAVSTSKLLHDKIAYQQFIPSERVGFVVGTSTGSIRSTSDFTRDSLVQERPFLVNPALFPNTVMNCAAGQCGIWFKARSVNATISGGRLSGLLAFKYALQMLRRRYADLLFTGSVEELCPQTAWAYRQLIQHERRRPVPLGEGCGMFALSRSADVVVGAGPAVAEILALQYGRYFQDLRTDPASAPNGVRQCLAEALDQAGIGPEQIERVILCGAADIGNDELERQAVTRMFGSDMPVHGGELLEQFGDTYSATFALNLGWLLGRLGQSKKQGPRYGLLLTTSKDGHVGCLVVRVSGEAS
jgi:3-oxoacyl-[acyl-carrier-protein] synthase II